MKIIKSILNWLCLLVGGKSKLTDEAVSAGVVNFEGQGKDAFGK